MADGEKRGPAARNEDARVRGKEKSRRTGEGSDDALKCVIKWTIAIGLLVMFVLGVVVPVLWCLYIYVRGDSGELVAPMANQIQIVATLLSCALSVYAMVQAYAGEKNMAKTLRKLEKLRKTVAEAAGLRKRKDNSSSAPPPSPPEIWDIHQDEINEKAPEQNGPN